MFTGSKNIQVAYQILKDIQMGLVDFVGNLIIYVPNLKFSVRTTTMVELDELVLLVPIITGPRTVIIILHISAIIVFIVIVLMTVVFLKKFLMLNVYHYDNIKILGIILNSPPSKSPTKTPERIMYSCILAVSFTYSASFVKSLTSFELTGGDALALHALEDLNKSNFPPIVHPVFKSAAFDANSAIGRDLGRQSIEGYHEQCIVMMLKYKNVSCVIFKSLAIAKLLTAEKVKPAMKLLGKSLWTAGTTMYVDPRFPYVNKFDKILTRIASVVYYMK